MGAPRVYFIGWRAYISQVDAPISQRRTYTLQLHGLLQQQRVARLPKSQIQAANGGNILWPIHALGIYISKVGMLYWRQMRILRANNKMSRARESLIKGHFRLSISSLRSLSQRSSDGRIVPSLMAGPVSHRTGASIIVNSHYVRPVCIVDDKLHRLGTLICPSRCLRVRSKHSSTTAAVIGLAVERPSYEQALLVVREAW